MTTYKKGDWVVFPNYNAYPVKLDEDAKFGGAHWNSLGWRFIEANNKEAKEMALSFVGYYVSDPRVADIYRPDSFAKVEDIRPAKKSDFKAIIESAKKAVKLAQKEVELYTKAMESV